MASSLAVSLTACHVPDADADEFLIITDRSIASLPDLLREFRGYGGLAVNWQVGSHIANLPASRVPTGSVSLLLTS